MGKIGNIALLIPLFITSILLLVADRTMSEVNRSRNLNILIIGMALSIISFITTFIIFVKECKKSGIFSINSLIMFINIFAIMYISSIITQISSDSIAAANIQNTSNVIVGSVLMLLSILIGVIVFMKKEEEHKGPALINIDAIKINAMEAKQKVSDKILPSDNEVDKLAKKCKDYKKESETAEENYNDFKKVGINEMKRNFMGEPNETCISGFVVNGECKEVRPKTDEELWKYKDSLPDNLKKSEEDFRKKRDEANTKFTTNCNKKYPDIINYENRLITPAELLAT